MIATELLGLVKSASSELAPESFFRLDSQGDVLTGYFEQGGEVCRFRLTQDGIAIEQTDSQAKYLAGFSQVRGDRKPDCENSNPCGEGCIAKGFKCTKTFSPQQQQVAKRLLSGEKPQRGAVAVGSVAAALGVAAVAAGVGLAIAASSGGGGTFQTPEAPPPPLAQPPDPPPQASSPVPPPSPKPSSPAPSLPAQRKLPGADITERLRSLVEAARQPATPTPVVPPPPGSPEPSEMTRRRGLVQQLGVSLEGATTPQEPPSRETSEPFLSSLPEPAPKQKKTGPLERVREMLRQPDPAPEAPPTRGGGPRLLPPGNALAPKSQRSPRKPAIAGESSTLITPPAPGVGVALPKKGRSPMTELLARVRPPAPPTPTGDPLMLPAGGLPTPKRSRRNPAIATENPALVTPPAPGVGVKLPKRGRSQIEELLSRVRPPVPPPAPTPPVTPPSLKAAKPEPAPAPAKPPRTFLPLRTEIERASDQLIRKHAVLGGRARMLAESPANPKVVDELQAKLSRAELLKRQMMNPLATDYFRTAAKEVPELDRAIAKADRFLPGLQSKVLAAGKNPERHAERVEGAIASIDAQLKRIQEAEASVQARLLGQSKPSDRNELKALQEQRLQLTGLRDEAATLRDAPQRLEAAKGTIADMKTRVAELPTRLSQLSPEQKAQYAAVEKIRALQGELPSRIAKQAERHNANVKAIEANQVEISAMAEQHDSERQFSIRSTESWLERQQARMQQSLAYMEAMGGRDGIKWVTSKSQDMPTGLELTLNQYKKEFGTASIQSVEQAAKFRSYVLERLHARIEGDAAEIEKRAQYPLEISRKWQGLASAKHSEVSELQKTAVIQGREQSQKLVADLRKTAQEMAVPLEGNSLLQPYRIANQSMIDDIQSAHAQTARAAGELLVDLDAVRDRLGKDAQTPPVFDVGGKAFTAEMLGEEVAAARAKARQLRTLQEYDISATAAPETEERLKRRAATAAQTSVVKAQIGGLQSRIGALNQQILKRQEAAARGQRKGVSTDRLEAEKAALQKDLDALITESFPSAKRNDLNLCSFDFYRINHKRKAIAGGRG
jgi:hypothetical protein